MKTKEYINKTRENYKDERIASNYKKAYSGKLSLRNFRIKMISYRERKVVKKFLSYISNEETLKNKKVLDIPAGTGKLTKILLYNGLNVTSGDISKEMMDQIDKDLKEHKNYIDERVMDATGLPFEDNSFDLVISIRLLHRVDAETRKKIIKEAERVSRKHCIISFAKDNLWHRLRIKLRDGDSSPGRERLRTIKKDLQEAGFEIKKKKSVLPIFSNEVIFLLRL
ncbi:MAG: methyltransferase domain-containing protein [Candidatus Paceibacterota bacterium]